MIQSQLGATERVQFQHTSVQTDPIADQMSCRFFLKQSPTCPMGLDC